MALIAVKIAVKNFNSRKMENGKLNLE